MENYLFIGKVNIRFHMFWHLLASILFLCAAPLLMGLSNLDSRQTAQVLEMYAALEGIILLVPIFLPENDKNIRELTASKYMGERKIWMIRLAESLAFLIFLYLAFVLTLKAQNCSFELWKFYAGTLASAIFLGGVGILGYALTDNVVIGYMIPMMYYICNFSGDKYVQKFYLFSMMKGSFDEKIWLAAGGIFCIATGFWYRNMRKC